MGYSIYYNRAFIRVGNKYIPLVNSGASNSADIVRGRLVSDKDWGVLNWKRRDRVLFSEAEICDIAKDYERNHQESGMCFKSRNKPFAPGELEKWIVGGMKRAYTIDEYCSAGNKLLIVDYPNGMIERWRTQTFTKEEELMVAISQFEARHEFHISFANSREVHRPVRRNVQGQENEKPSVLERIAAAQAEQRQTKPEGRDALSHGKKKSHGEEL